ncbi:hypothetical protein [Alcanivorax sp.]|uniref:hypothetical protein n=1 Tax=Alcanivorax sp. TaxID=1872427 RepID=UPI002B26D108|nr:hypothetical protein [Alcanivorax sp.]
MAWKDDDDKEITGPKDGIWVSPTETWEIDHFVEEYLKDHSYKVNDKNRAIVKRTIDNYSGSNPIKRDDLIDYLNQKFKKS